MATISKNVNKLIMTEIPNNQTIVIIALFLMIILGIFTYSLYYGSNFDINGMELGCYDTIRNMLGLLPVINEIVTSLEDTITSGHNLIENKLIEVTKDIKKINKKKEVFNIDNNNYTYDDARLLCKAYDSKLATYDQVVKAYKKGGNWCNYGWSENGMALYPTQENYYHELQKGDKKYRDSCGKPGINGGNFDNKDLKFGVNCFGYKPKPDKSKISFGDNKYLIPELNRQSEKDMLKIKQYKSLITKGDIQLRPFSENKWSNYSFKNSSYMLTSKDNVDDIVVVEDNINDTYKDPRNIENTDDVL
tara:strand:+ start:4149 stop:5063 length:915 start_codon:yes stop_codon:yes gene_type:complete